MCSGLHRQLPILSVRASGCVASRISHTPCQILSGSRRCSVRPLCRQVPFGLAGVEHHLEHAHVADVVDGGPEYDAAHSTHPPGACAAPIPCNPSLYSGRLTET